MAWTKKQLDEARRLKNRRGNKLTWAECIAKATKATKAKPAKKTTVSGKRTAKKSVRKVVVNKNPVSVKIAGTAGSATQQLVDTQKKIIIEQDRLQRMQGAGMAGMSAMEKNRHKKDVKTQKEFISTLRKNLTSLKRFIK